MDAAGLMVAGQSTFIVTTAARIIRTNVTLVLLAQLLNRIFYRSADNNNDETNNSVR